MRTPEEVTARWRELASLSDLATGRRLATKVPMSPEAVSLRLRKVGELRRVCLALARRQPPPSAPRGPRSPTGESRQA